MLTGYRSREIALLLSLGLVSAGLYGASSDRWVPARWEGGPLEVARRAEGKTVAADGPTRDAILKWYDPATLGLLEGTPINCLLVTFSAGKGAEIEAQQRQLVKEYAQAARQRGIAVLGIVYPGSDPLTVAAAAADAQLDGLVLDGEFPAAAAFPAKLEAALRERNSTAVVIPIQRDARSMRDSKAPLVAVEGVRPDARNMGDMGIVAGASAEPWIDSNLWLVRSFRRGAAWRPVWVNQQAKSPSRWDYLTAVADAAAAGGRWLVALDDSLQAGLFHKDAEALATWRVVGAYLKFAEDHAAWRDFNPFGNVALIVDRASEIPDYSNELLNLVARRQIPYRLIERSELSAAALAGFRAVVPADLTSPTPAERQLLRAFVEQGGTVFAGPWWGGAPQGQDYAEVPLGKGLAIVYSGDPPDPGNVAKDVRDILPPDATGFTAFNVPSLITYVSSIDGGKRKLIQFVNYASRPFEFLVTIRIEGTFKTARLYSPQGAVVNMEARPARIKGQTEVGIPRLDLWSVLELE
jgi:hypothetical protein